MIDKLIERIIQLDNPTVVGIDTAFDYLPLEMRENCTTMFDVGNAITEFNCKIIDLIASIVPAVKVQVAYYEMYGIPGMIAFENTIAYAKEKGLIVIADVKRNDIGSTAACYSNAYLGNVDINGNKSTAFDSDFITVNGYLGVDGIKPFVDDCKKFDKGIFVLVKTSNPSSGQLQDKVFADNSTLYESMGKLVDEWGKPLIGKHGFSDVGAVVGATHPDQAIQLRKQLPNTFFLVPGYGAQGGSAADLAGCFNRDGLGAIVNSSRGIICAYKSPIYKGLEYQDAAYCACMDMKEDINKYIKKGVSF